MNKKRTQFQPVWYEELPRPKSYRSVFKWGHPGVFKHPNHRLYRMLKAELALTDDDFRTPRMQGHQEVKADPGDVLSPEQIQVFETIVGRENIEMDDYARVKFSNGKTMEEAIRLRDGRNGPVSDLVVHPRNKRDVAKVVAYCHEQKIPIYVYSGGSSVTLGFQPARGGITLVMSTHMNRFLELNEINQTARIQPGIFGPAYEKALNDAPQLFGTRHRFTGGHFPQSFEYSTVGGWVLTLGSGQQSSYYGDACDLAISQEYITPRGQFMTKEYPATATGPKVNDIMKGSEGSFGILVELTMKIFRYQPKSQLNFAFIFPNWEKAVSASREIFQAEFGNPSVFRISDAEETDVAMKLYGIEGTFLDRLIQWRGFRPNQRCLCIGHTEGESGFASQVRKKIKRICRSHHAMYITGYPVKKWQHGRYADPYMREDLHDYGIVIDTLESSTTWDNLHRLYEGVRSYIKSRPKTVCMTHASHFYAQGTNLYFIYISRFKDIDDYKTFKEGIIDRILAFGGSLSHHHGVGKLMGSKMTDHLGREQMEILRAVKRHLDPHHIMNPGGQMGLDSFD